MKNPLLLHDLLYIGEHQTCNHYRADVGSGFIYEELEAGETERLDTVRRNHLLILLEGRCSLDCNQFSGRDFSAGEMILVPRSAAFSGRTLTRVRLLDMAFEKPESGCDRLVLQSYHTLCHFLTIIEDSFHHLRKLYRQLPHTEKGCLGITLVKRIQNPI